MRGRGARCVWFLSLAAAVGLFASGFLLTRVECPELSDERNPAPTSGPWPRALYRRAVLVVVDALRWDLVNGATFPRLLQRLAANDSRWAAFPFWSDPPTTTSQRLKGLTTGTLPTFIDVSRNFASANVSEDNWLDQLVRHQRHVTFLGDDTWLKMFPGRFRKEYGFPSFNTRDLHTVDDGVLRHLLPELRNADWDVLIAHFLGVDHVGHTHGPDHPAMTTKLAQMNGTLEALVNELEHHPDTLLVVLGDHGMTASGNHGGASDDELCATLLLYSAGGLAYGARSPPGPLPQINLVPSLALALGVPIPFASLGSLIPELFPADQLLAATQANAFQVQRFVARYVGQRADFPAARLQELSTTLARAQSLSSRPEERQLALQTFNEYLSGVASMCRAAWATFDVPRMQLALLLQVAALLLLLSHAAVDWETLLRGGLAGALLALLLGECAECAIYLPVVCVCLCMFGRLWRQKVNE
jgi:phosphatidylinositol glycan class O